ncbi:archaeal proteasome endopeptidase complex subunit alpha [Haloarcula rubripromontorii]|uniref:Proteasome subunit alpha n=1 Tax=Haloarcula rubripromontorii TaxID=1705562 RepID=A0A0N0U9X3_9EURY|nr:archaeal proteasome endopeptidase complex subunit alpha [Haloarcula rubripromontorii]KOX93833.1 proteasome subunit alpha [Haloarcula rubripromontorii]NLV05735.1 archaeal proteasome endopeptidase complex subunit alpha [Haloarcula rubripromontorii]
MQGNEQQAYDRGITIFSPDGRLYQVEYAREAVKRGTASVGVRTEDGVVIAADRHARSPLIERDSIEKIHEIDSHVGVASAGHVADARQLIDVARRQAQVNRLRYDEPASVESLTKEITDYIQQYTQTGGARPFGVALLVAGIEAGEPRLFETDPSGTPYEWQAVAIGGSREDIQSFLEDEYAEGMDLEGGIELALRALASVNDDGLDATGVDIATIDVETEQFEKLSEDDIAERLEEFELGGEN